MRSSVRPHWSFLIALLTGAGCVSATNYYRVEMAPADAGLERAISVAVVDSSRTPKALGEWRQAEWEEIADRLERVYGVRPDTVAPYVTRGRFGDIPEDLGNWGLYRSSRTPLGSSFYYLERFGGNPDQSGNVTQAVEESDSLYDLVHLWLSSELGRHARWPAVSTYLDRHVRSRLRDIATASFLETGLPSEGATRIIMVLEQPELFALCLMASGFDEIESPLFSEAMAFDRLRAGLADALDLRTPTESKEALAFLSDRRHAEASMSKAVAADRNLQPEKALELWSDAVSDLEAERWSEGLDSLIVQFNIEVEPEETNGEWDGSSHRVVWRTGYSGPRPGSNHNPIYCYAEWVLPDSVLQTRLFGRLILSGEDLDRYCWRYASLDSTDQAEWDRMLLSIKTGKLKPIERFRFADERKRGTKAGESRARPLVDLLLEETRSDSKVAGR